MALGNNSKAPDINSKALQCHCTIYANHLEQRSCFYNLDVGILQGISAIDC